MGSDDIVVGKELKAYKIWTNGISKSRWLSFRSHLLFSEVTAVTADSASRVFWFTSVQEGV